MTSKLSLYSCTNPRPLPLFTKRKLLRSKMTRMWSLKCARKQRVNISSLEVEASLKALTLLLIIAVTQSSWESFLSQQKYLIERIHDQTYELHIDSIHL